MISSFKIHQTCYGFLKTRTIQKHKSCCSTAKFLFGCGYTTQGKILNLQCSFFYVWGEHWKWGIPCSELHWEAWSHSLISLLGSYYPLLGTGEATQGVLHPVLGNSLQLLLGQLQTCEAKLFQQCQHTKGNNNVLQLRKFMWTLGEAGAGCPGGCDSLSSEL